MEPREHPRVMPGLEVFDSEGSKVGTVTHLHETVGSTERTVDGTFEVKTGLFGLGKHYFVPFRAIAEVTTGGVFLKRSRADFDALGWGDRTHQRAA